ncbi:MAG: DUF1800 domain-containing protein [Bacteroidetes bacterium]|nr:DUF1800 domain-containing protein [Bacteroidota bacterium]
MEINQKYHLHNRASFFVHRDELDEKSSLEAEIENLFNRQQVQLLTTDLPEWNPEKMKEMSDKEKDELRKKNQEVVLQLGHTWIRQMMNPQTGFNEKMTLFWHGHFACRTIQNAYLTLEMNNLLRTHALGNFRDLLYAVSKSAAMIQYLHLQQNRKAQPNEDFARELCELFTLGRDVDYAESDVTEIARAFTGWGSDKSGKFFFNEKQHDSGTKTIFGKTGNFKGEDVLEMILANPHTAFHIVKKVYRFFVQETTNDEHLQSLSQVFYESDYDIKTLMKALFAADWFYESKGKLIKSPVEFMVGLGKLFDLKFEDPKTLFKLQHFFGQVLFDPPNVAGWPGGRQWIDSSRLALRLRIGSLIVNKGLIEEELSPSFDAQLQEAETRGQLKFFEEVDWDNFWKRAADANLVELIIRTENPFFPDLFKNRDSATVVQLISTPDYQLI